MKKLIKYVIYAIIILVIFLGVSSYIKAKTAPLKVKTSKAEIQTITTTITSNGKIQPKESYALNFTSSGRIIYFPYEEGDTVTKGKVIATLENTTGYEQTNKAQADYRLAIEKIREFEYNNKDKPKDDKYNLQKYQLEAQRDSSAAIYKQYIATQRNAVIVSPITGVITQINTKAGETTSLATPVLTVAALDTLEFVAEVDEQDAGKIASGQTAEISLDALTGTPITGTIYDIAQIAKTNSTGGTYYPTKISLTTSNDAVRTGMNGDVTITTQEKVGVLTVPSEALMEDDDNRFVYVIENGKAKKKTIKTGIENDTHTEIISGIEVGAEVITSDQEKVTDGVKVEKQ